MDENVVQDTTGKLVKQLNAFDVNWVESKILADRLAQLGVSNVEYMPNFKELKSADASSIKTPDAPPYRFCTFSRVTPAKGIPDAIKAVTSLNDEGVQCSLDIYGPIAPDFETDFAEMVQDNPYAQYCGCVDVNASVEVLQDYSALLFPTTWPGEG
ncbi:MAG: hypothetical protein BZ138_06370, partial [Methanosphaera sp. rholeuAM270]